MSEATVETTSASKSRRIPNPQRFGYERDAAEAGRKGGRASGISRKLARQRAIEAAVFERSKNGYALIRLHEIEARRNEALERERVRMDGVVNQLMDWATAERKIVEQARAEKLALLKEGDELRRRNAAIEAACAAGETTLVERLQALNASDPSELDRVLERLDVLERVDDEAG